MKKFIAYFDILGYGDRIKNKSIDEEYEIQKEIIEDIVKIIENNATKRTDFCTMHFSDTHIFYTKDVSEDAFEIIIKSSLIFMLLAAVRKHPYLPLRGVINYGDFMGDYDRSIFIGEGLREAYALEKRQEWMGCFLSDSCYEQAKNFEIFKEFAKKLVLVKYSVPFKDRAHSWVNWIKEVILRQPQKLRERKDKYVINMESFPRVWGDECKNMPLTDPKFIENIFVNRGIDDSDLLKLNKSAEEKLKNTQQFFNYIKRHTVFTELQKGKTTTS